MKSRFSSTLSNCPHIPHHLPWLSLVQICTLVSNVRKPLYLPCLFSSCHISYPFATVSGITVVLHLLTNVQGENNGSVFQSSSRFKKNNGYNKISLVNLQSNSLAASWKRQHASLLRYGSMVTSAPVTCLGTTCNDNNQQPSSSLWGG